MNTQHIYNRLLRPLRVDSLEGLSLNQGQDLVDALNAALDEFYSLAPVRYRQQEVSFRLRAPLELEGDFVKGSPLIENVNNLNLRGLTVVAGSDEANGTYVQNGETAGKRAYYNLLTNVTISWDIAGSWEFATAEGVVLYRSTEDVESPDLVTTWTVEPGGSAPAPVVSVLAEILSDTFYGCSVRVQGDANWNRVEADNTLLVAYEGESGRKSFTVYSDAVPFGGLTVERVYRHPRRSDDGRELMPYDPYATFDPACYAYNDMVSCVPANVERNLGVPTRYRVLPVGTGSTGAVAVPSVLVVEPVPVNPISLVTGIVHQPVQFDVGSLRKAITLPLPDNLVRTIVIPLAWSELADSDNWKPTSNTGMYLERADRARLRAKTLPEYFATPNHRIGTPRGY